MALLEEIETLTREGEKLSPEVRDRLILRTLGSVLERLNEVDAKQEALEKTSIGLWVRNNPKMATTVIGIGFILLNLWFVSDFRKPVMTALGLPSDLIP